MTALVVDSSIVIGWIVPSQSHQQSDAALSMIESGALLVVPAVWPLEVANSLLALVRRRKLSAMQYRAGLTFLRGLSAQIDPESTAQALGATVELAERYALSTYDASYLELSARLSLPLATRDAALAAAAGKHGVRVGLS